MKISQKLTSNITQLTFEVTQLIKKVARLTSEVTQPMKKVSRAIKNVRQRIKTAIRRAVLMQNVIFYKVRIRFALFLLKGGTRKA